MMWVFVFIFRFRVRPKKPKRRYAVYLVECRFRHLDEPSGVWHQGVVDMHRIVHLKKSYGGRTTIAYLEGEEFPIAIMGDIDSVLKSLEEPVYHSIEIG